MTVLQSTGSPHRGEGHPAGDHLGATGKDVVDACAGRRQSRGPDEQVSQYGTFWREARAAGFAERDDITDSELTITPEQRPSDMLWVADSIKVGKMTPSTILRRLGSDSAKNKLYFAFRELGRVIRTLFLLKYLNEPELRRTIRAATNKSEQFNDFAQWLMFGGDGIIAENVRHEQRKVIKYNHLVANMVILYNVQWMSRKLKALQEKGHPVDAEVLKVLSPYRRDHINRLGDYLLDLQRRAPPLDPTIEFLFKSAA